jgi:hypothetical protein
MPRGDAVLYVRLPREIRDRVARVAASEGISTNAWCARELHRASLHHTTRHDTEQHHATPHDGTAHPTPVTIVDVIRNTTEGTPLIAPCGKTWPCKDEIRTTIAGTDYCDTCGVKLP